MMSSYASDLLNHIKQISQWTAECGAASSMQLPSGVLRIQWKNRFFDFQPQFRNRSADGSWQLSLGLNPDSNSFCGWLPYFNKQWPAACRKLEFKRLASQLGIATPEYWDESGVYENVLIKKEVSSFGNGVAGPFLRTGKDHADLLLGPGEYYEKFVPGQVAKILYWNKVPVCLEVMEMASVTGDGESSVESLLGIVSSYKGNRERALAIIENMIQYSGKRMTSVLAKGEKLNVDPRYGSPVYPTTTSNTNCLHSASEALRAQLGVIGQKLHQAIPEPIRAHTVFSVDGIIDDSGTLWCVEMNCNPQLHPDIYPTMLPDLFGDASVFLDAYQPLHLNNTLPRGQHS